MMLDAFNERKDKVTAALRDLGEVAGELGAKTLRDRISRDLVKKLDEDRFHLVVVGEFNHGKSTFVNALLGHVALPVGVTPTTAAIHHLRYADQPEAVVAYSTGRREKIPFEDVRKFAVGGEARNKIHGPQNGVSEPREGGDAARAEEVDFIEVGYPAPLLRERILLVDTPGVNDLSLQRADITYSYIPRADAVLFLLDAGQILKESERIFLEDKLLKASRDKIVFVITKWDILSTEEQVEAFKYAKDQLARLVKDPVIFPISAETALAGNAEASGMANLLAYLTTYLAEERGRILLDNALGEGQNVTALLVKGVDARRRSLAMKAEELDRRIALLEQDLAGQAGTIEQRRMRIREEVTGIKVGAKKDLERFVDDTLRQLPHVIDSAKGEDLKKYLPAFLEDTFRAWAEAESKEIAASLETLAEKTIALVRDDAHETTKRVAATLGGDVKQLDVNIDTFGYDIGVVALFTVGFGVLFANVFLGGLLIAAAPVLAMFVRDKVDAEYKKRAKELAPGVLRAAADKVAPKMDAMIEDFIQKLDAWVVSAGEELHREVLEVLHATRTARIGGAEDETKARSVVEEQAARLAASKTHIEELRAALWVNAVKAVTAETSSEGGAAPVG